MRASPRSGFSLVELSVVITIIGLLVGGIMVGWGLIKSAEMRATIKQIDDLRLVTNTFKDKYMGLPGDLPNASNYWPTALNGNGNGLIEVTACGAWTLYDPDCSVFNGERSNFFVQLGLAGLTTTYDGSDVLNKGYPSIKLHPKQGLFVSGPQVKAGSSNMNISQYATSDVYIAMVVCNAAKFNKSPASQHNDCGVFTPEEAWGLDNKMDDGQPLSGKFLAESWGGYQCLNGTSYKLNNSGFACNALYDLTK